MTVSFSCIPNKIRQWNVVLIKTAHGRVNMARSVTQILGQLFCYLIIRIYQIWWLLALAVPPRSLGNFFYRFFRERGLTFLKGEKSTLSNMVILCIIRIQTLYWLKNAKVSENHNTYFFFQKPVKGHGTENFLILLWSQYWKFLIWFLKFLYCRKDNPKSCSDILYQPPVLNLISCTRVY